MKKRSIITVIIFLMAFSLLPTAKTYAAMQIQTGEYIQMGVVPYWPEDDEEDQPLIWICLDADDPHGPLMMATNNRAPNIRSGTPWEESGLRRHLNQSYPIVDAESTFPDCGYLRGFTLSERRAMRLVPQYTLLHETDRELAEDPYAPIYSSFDLDQYVVAESNPWLRQKLADVLFPPGVDQIKKALDHFDAIAIPNAQGGLPWGFQLRVPDPDNREHTLSLFGHRMYTPYREHPWTGTSDYEMIYYSGYGWNTQPCFYLNQVTAQVRSGSGTKEDPYVVDTDCDFDDGKIIRIQGANLPYDTPVYEDQGETMVPLRAIIEALGGEISWDAATRTVQFNCRGVAARIEIGSAKVQVNGEDRWPAVAPQLRYDRTYVPFTYFENVFGLQQPWTTGWEENGQLLELLDAADEKW